MSTVTMRHPDLPSEQEIEVDEAAVPVHAAAGWQRVPAGELEVRQQRAQAELQKLLDRAPGTADAEHAEHVPEPSAESEPPAETSPSEPARKRRRATPETSEES